MISWLLLKDYLPHNLKIHVVRYCRIAYPSISSNISVRSKRISILSYYKSGNKSEIFSCKLKIYIALILKNGTHELLHFLQN